MRIILSDVISVDGKITKGSEPDIKSWRSPEDWEHFVRLRDKSEVIILDRKTYEVVKPTPEEGKLRIVFTSTPQRFETVPGQLEFVNESPAELVGRLSKTGYKKALLAGGARLSSDFLTAGLINEIYLTIEPVLFGNGRPMFIDTEHNLSLTLESCKQLNERGTLLLHYLVEPKP